MPTSNLGFELHNEASGRLHILNPLLQNTISDIFTSLFIIIILSKKTYGYGNVFAPLFSLLKGSGAFCFHESVVWGNLGMCLAQNYLLNFCGFPIVSFIYHYMGFFLLIRILQLCHRHEVMSKTLRFVHVWGTAVSFSPMLLCTHGHVPVPWVSPNFCC